MSGAVDLDALLAALILAPRTFARNRFFTLFQNPEAAKVRRRAARVRGILRQLAGTPKPSAELVGERVMNDGQVLIRYHVADLGYTRTAALSSLEAATLRYALHRAGKGPLSADDKALVEGVLTRLGAALDLGGKLLETPTESASSSSAEADGQ